MARLPVSRQHLRALWFGFGLVGLIAACPCEPAQAGVSDAGRLQLAAGVQRVRRATRKRVTVPSVSLAVAPTQVRPGGYATYTITTSRINRRRAIWINYAVGGTATMGKDYNLSGTSGQTVIRAGASSSDVALNALPNNLSTGDQVAAMILQPGNGYNLSSSNKAAVTIVNPTPTPRPTATPRPTPAPSPSAAREIWIAVRTDGLPGLGTQANPYDGSTQKKFDALLNAIPPNVTINLGAGTFRTHKFATDAGWQQGNVKSGWTIQGAGMYSTTIQAAGPVAGIHYNVAVLETPNNISTDNVTLRDFTVDCNWAELGPTADTGGTVRTITNASTTSGSPTVTASGGAFTATDIGNVIIGTGIPDNCFIGVRNSSTSVGLSSSPTAYVPVNATATANDVTLTIAQKQIAVTAVRLLGSNNLIERCRHINTFGAATTNNEEFGFVLSAPLTSDATGNVIRFCRGESPAGHYGSAFNIFGYDSPTRYTTNSEIHDCVAVGTNTGLQTGFTNGLGGFAYVKNCQFYNNTAIDVGRVFYNDTGTLENIRIANNTLVRGYFGVGLVADGPNESWTKKNIQIIDNKLNIQNRVEGGSSWAVAIRGATSSNISIAGNYITFDPSGDGSKSFVTIAFSEVVGGIISGNIADEASGALGAPHGEALGTNITLCSNRTTTGAPLTGLPDNCPH